MSIDYAMGIKSVDSKLAVALQQFNWADQEHLDKAIGNLVEAEKAYEAYLRSLRSAHPTKGV